MKRQDIIWIVVIILFLLWCIHYYKPTTIVIPEMDTSTHYYNSPKPDMSRNPSYYDWRERKWIYFNETDKISDPTKREYPEELMKEQMQKYLEEHIDDYLEDTYWGEEYDITDKEDDGGY